MKDRHYLLIYDISNQRRLIKCAKIVENYGIRVQKSVFELETNRNIIKKLTFEIKKVINIDIDSFIIFELCESDWQKKEKYGVKPIEEDKKFYIY